MKMNIKRLNSVFSVSGHVWLPQNVGSKIIGKYKIWPDVHKINGTILSVSLILCNCISQNI